MATSTFERKLEITDTESIKKLIDIIATDAPDTPSSVHPFSSTERERSEALLKQFLSH